MVRVNQLVAAVLSAPALVRASVIARQQGSILDPNRFPEVCVVACHPAAEYLKRFPNCSTDPNCRCSPEFVVVLGPCANCIIEAQPTAFDMTPAVFAQRYSDSCDAAGFMNVTVPLTPVSTASSLSAVSTDPVPVPLPSLSPSVPASSASTSHAATSTDTGASISLTGGADIATWSIFSFIVAAVIGVATFV